MINKLSETTGRNNIVELSEKTNIEFRGWVIQIINKTTNNTQKRFYSSNSFSFNFVKDTYINMISEDI